MCFDQTVFISVFLAPKRVIAVYVLILHKEGGNTELLQYALTREGCTQKAVFDFISLLTEIRLKLPDCIVIYRSFFPASSTTEQITRCLDMFIPIHWFEFSILLYDVNNDKAPLSEILCSELCTEEKKEQTRRLLNSAMHTIHRLQCLPQQFRAAEKKLYAILMETNAALSLKEMSYALWGTCTSAHIKTLYTYIHRIKHLLQEDQSRPEVLVKIKKGCYKLTFGEW